jgi:hypothetical protein
LLLSEIGSLSHGEQTAAIRDRSLIALQTQVEITRDEDLIVVDGFLVNLFGVRIPAAEEKKREVESKDSGSGHGSITSACLGTAPCSIMAGVAHHVLVVLILATPLAEMGEMRFSTIVRNGCSSRHPEKVCARPFLTSLNVCRRAAIRV